MDRNKSIPVPRRSHTKSRNGCVPCKERHMKCDEIRPSCGLCIRRELNCTYSPAPLRASQKHSSRSESQANSDDARQSPTVKEEVPSRLREMKLFHHYLLNTSYTLIKNSQDQFFWQMWAPEVATSHEYVMDIILAVAALHLASSASDADESQFWLCSALQYHTQALAGFRDSLKVISSEGSRASFVCSICNVVFVTGYQTISHDEGRRDPLDDFLEVRVMLKMTRFLGNQSDRSQANPFFDAGLHSAHMAVFQEESFETKLIDLRRSTLEKLQAFGCKIVHANPEDEAVLKDTYRLIDKAITAWPTNSESIMFPLEVSDAFVDLLKRGDWMARIMLMFHGLAMHLHSRLWVTKDSGKRLILAVLPRKNGVSPEWKELITWMEEAVNV